MHALYDGVRCNDQTLVPSRRDYRRIISRADKDRSGRTRKACQQPRQERVLAQIRNGQEDLPLCRVGRIAEPA